VLTASLAMESIYPQCQEHAVVHGLYRIEIRNKHGES
jgi:hypothetical protein